MAFKTDKKNSYIEPELWIIWAKTPNTLHSDQSDDKSIKSSEVQYVKYVKYTLVVKHVVKISHKFVTDSINTWNAFHSSINTETLF